MGKQWDNRFLAPMVIFQEMGILIYCLKDVFLPAGTTIRETKHLFPQVSPFFFSQLTLKLDLFLKDVSF